MARRLLPCIAIVLVAVASANASETLESLEKKLGEAAAKVKALSCKEHEVLDHDMGGGNSMHKDAEASIEFRRDGAKVQWRSEQKATQVQRAGGGKESKSEFNNVEFDDGERSWMVLTSGGKTTAYKMKMRKGMEILADKSFFDELKSKNEVTVLPDAEVDEKKCAVIETLPTMFKGKLQPGQAVTRYYIRLDTGLIVKKVINDVKGKPMTTTTRSDIKLDPTLGPERFAPPPGATVVDMK